MQQKPLILMERNQLSNFSSKIHLQRVRISLPMEKAAEPWNTDLGDQCAS
jgi:hypothetical protein